MIKNNTITIYNTPSWDSESIDLPLFFDPENLSLTDEENISLAKKQYFNNLKIENINNCRFNGDSLFVGEININTPKLFSNTYISFDNINNGKTFYYFVKSVKINNINEKETSTTLTIQLDLWTTFHEEFFTSIKGSFVVNRYTDKRYKQIGSNWFFDYSKDKDVWNIDPENLNLNTYGYESKLLIEKNNVYTYKDDSKEYDVYVYFQNDNTQTYDYPNVYFFKNNGNVSNTLLDINIVGNISPNNHFKFSDNLVKKLSINDFKVKLKPISNNDIEKFFSRSYKYIAINQTPYYAFVYKEWNYNVDKNANTSYSIKSYSNSIENADGKNYVNRINEDDILPINFQGKSDTEQLQANINMEYYATKTFDTFGNSKMLLKDVATGLANILEWKPVKLDKVSLLAQNFDPDQESNIRNGLLFCYKLTIPNIKTGADAGNLDFKGRDIFYFTNSPFMKDTPSIEFSFKNNDDLNKARKLQIKTKYNIFNDMSIHTDEDELRVSSFNMNTLGLTQFENINKIVFDKDYENIIKPEKIDITKDDYNYLLEPQIWMSHCYKNSIMRNGKEYEFYSELGNVRDVLIYSKFHLAGVYERIILKTLTPTLQLNLLKTNNSFNYDNTKASVSDSYTNYLTNNRNSLETGLYSAEKNINYQKKMGVANTLSAIGNLGISGVAGGIGGMITTKNPIGGAIGAVSGVFSGGMNIAKTAINTEQSIFDAKQQLKSIQSQQKDLFNSPDKILGGDIQAYEREINNEVNTYIFGGNSFSSSTFLYSQLPTISTLKSYSDSLNRNGYLSGNQLYDMNIRNMIKRKYFNYWEIQDISTAILEPKLNPYVFNYFREKFNIGVRMWNITRGKIKDYTKQNWDEGMK